MDLKVNNRNGGWGTLLISLGLIALMDNFTIPDWYKVPVLAAAGLIAFVFYIRTRTDWVALIPVYILWAGALITAAVLWDLVNDDVLAVAVLPVFAIPFLYTYFKDRKKWWALIPAYIFLLIALLMLCTEVLGMDDEFIALILMPGFALPFLVVYFKNQQRWWALIPAYVFLLIGLLITMDEVLRLGEEIIAPGIVGGIGLPFLYVYFRNRENWWALIPSYILLAIATMIGLLEFRLLTGLAIPSFIMLAIAVPFIFVYFHNRENKWALIPGGIIALMGLGFSLGTDFGKYLTPAVLVIAGAWMLVEVIRK